MEKIITKDDSDVRLDRWLNKNELVNSVVEAQKFIRSGKIRVNGGKVKINARVYADDAVSYPDVTVNKVKDGKKEDYKASPQDEDMLIKSILYKDDNVIVIDKPAGLAVQGGSGSFKNLDSMLDVFRFGSEIRPKLVHRLDKHTSGVFIIARNNQTAKKMLACFKDKQVKKTYLAWAVGIPSKKEGLIRASLLKKIGDNEKVIVSPRGKDALTKYKVIKEYQNEASLIELYPETGRMHQLRVHLSYIGHPIVGDGKYGSKKAYLKGFSDKMHLHAQSVTFPDPDNAEKSITVRAEAPLWFSR